MKALVHTRFPCGYSFYMNVEGPSMLMDYAEFKYDGKDLAVCPLHGKRCPKVTK